MIPSPTLLKSIKNTKTSKDMRQKLQDNLAIFINFFIMFFISPDGVVQCYSLDREIQDKQHLVL